MPNQDTPPQKKRFKVAIVSVVITAFLLTVGYYGVSIFKLSRYTTTDIFKMMLDPTSKNDNIYFPPYAFESHIYLIRGDKASIEAIKDFGGLSMFFMRSGPGTRTEMRKRITKFYMNKGIDINSVSGEGDYPVLHFATSTNQADVVKWLLENGADPKLKAKMSACGRDAALTPLEIAQCEAEKHTELVMQGLYDQSLKEAKEKGAIEDIEEAKEKLLAAFDETIKVLRNHLAETSNN